MTAGFFGKLPAHGDFVERGLPTLFTHRWDEWLQQSIAASKSALGDQWRDVYVASPVWRFALGSGVLSDQSWAGVMLPSVDKVGRHFPLTIAEPYAGDVMTFQVVVASESWHDSVEQIALQGLHDETTDAEAVLRSLSALTDLDALISQVALRAVQAGTGQVASSMVSMAFTYGTSPGQGLMAFAHRLAESRFGTGYSVWWTHGSSSVLPKLVVTTGLPALQMYSGFLTEQVKPEGWDVFPAYTVGSDLQPPNQPSADDLTMVAPAAAEGIAPAPGGEDLGQLSDLLGGGVENASGGVGNASGGVGNARGGVENARGGVDNAGAEDRTVIPEDFNVTDHGDSVAEPTENAGFASLTPVSSDEILAGFGTAEESEEITQTKYPDDDRASDASTRPDEDSGTAEDEDTAVNARVAEEAPDATGGDKS